MVHAQQREPVKNINKSPGQHCWEAGTGQALLHRKTVCRKKDSRKPEPHNEVQIMISKQIHFRQKDLRKAERISYDVVRQRRVQILSIPHPKRKSRQTEFPRMQEIFKHLLPPVGK